MKRLLNSFVAVAMISILMSACTSSFNRQVDEISQVLDSLENIYASDSRVVVWDLQVELSNKQVSLRGELSSCEGLVALETCLTNRFHDLSMDVELLGGEDGVRPVNALVNNSVIHLRKEPSSKTELVTQTLLGTPVKLLKEAHGKVLIQIPDGYIGWVNPAEVVPIDSEELAAYRAADKIIFTEQYGFVYSEADDASQVVSDLVIGNILAIKGEADDYLEVAYPDQRTGWVKKIEIVPASEVFYNEPTPDELLETALKFNGIPYLWGGTSSKNIDCSGFVYNIYYMNGIQLPRDADPQSRCGREVSTSYSPEGLECGDLLFFGHKAKGDKAERVTHVAFYMGEGNFIHSAGYKERVSINSMDSTGVDYIESYPDSYLRTVRILGEEQKGFRPIPENSFFKAIISE